MLYEVITQRVVDHIIVVDDGSRDRTVEIAEQLKGVQVFVHDVITSYSIHYTKLYDEALPHHRFLPKSQPHCMRA